MKKYLLKALDIIINIIMIANSIYAVFNLVMTFLPVEIQTVVFNWLHMSQEYIATFSISATINAAILIFTKIAQTQTRIALTSKLTKAELVIQNDVALYEQMKNRFNVLADNYKAQQQMLNALLEVQKVTTERNINASEKLVRKSEKDAYKRALETIEKAQQVLQDLNNITSVYERTEIKEIVVPKDSDDITGRV